MENPEDESQIREAYRRFIEEEVHRPEVRRDKKSFIKEYFRPEPFILFRPVVFVPAFTAVAAFLIFTHLLPIPQQRIPVEEVQETGIYSEVATHQAVETGQEGDSSADFADHSSVNVRRATSRVGQVMVYQKVYQDVPLTVVWVFTGGNHL